MRDMAQKVLAAYVVATALAAFVLLIVTPLTHDGSPEYPVWKVLNYFMAVATFVILVVGCYRKCTLCKEAAQPTASEQVTANVVFYGAVALTMLFFWEWFWTLNPDSETGEAVTSHIIYFPFVDALFTVLGLATGRYLWTCARGRSG